MSKFSKTIDEIFTLENLYDAYLSAKKKKSKKRKILEFSIELGKNLQELHEDIISRKYSPDSPATFNIKCDSGNKIRTISAPSFRDSIVQHCIYNEIYDTFDRGFIHDNYGCRKNKGTHKAADRCQEFLRKSKPNTYYLQLDIRRYYYTINHKVLRRALARKIEHHEVVDLILSFAKGTSKSGLGPGNLLTQLKGIIYLDSLDHFIKRKIKCKRYIRYVDDMLIIGETKLFLIKVKRIISNYIKRILKMTLSKWKLVPIRRGINFVGYRTWASRRFIRKKALVNFTRAVRNRKWVSINSLLSHAKHTSSYQYMLNIIRVSYSNKEILMNFNKQTRMLILPTQS